MTAKARVAQWNAADRLATAEVLVAKIIENHPRDASALRKARHAAQEARNRLAQADQALARASTPPPRPRQP